MKHLFIAIMATVALFSCKPSDIVNNAPAINGPGNYRAGFVSKSGADTTWTATRRTARIETIGLDSATDNKLKVVLVAYANIAGKGYYTLDVINLMDCRSILRWNWDGDILPTSIEPTDSTAGTSQSDVIAAHQTKRYIVIGNAKPGRIKVKAESVEGNCGNSSTIIINITPAILPIIYTDFTVTFNETLERVFVGFTISQPTDLKCVIIQHLVGEEYKTILVALGDDNITKYNIKLP